MKNNHITLALICGVLCGLTACGDKNDQPRPIAEIKAQPTVSQTASVATQPTPVSAQSAPISTLQTAATNEPASNQAGLSMPAVAKRHNCPACHSITKKIVGPAWMNVSIKYKGVDKFDYNGKEYPLVEGLMMKVSLGGSGHWGSMPMPANDYKGVMQADIRELVLFVLGLAK